MKEDKCVINGDMIVKVTKQAKNDRYYNIPETIKSIGPFAFSNCKNLKWLYLKNLEIVDCFAFKNCQRLQVVILENVKLVEKGAFSKCPNLQAAYVVNTNLAGEDIFKGCSKVFTLQESAADADTDAVTSFKNEME